MWCDQVLNHLQKRGNIKKAVNHLSLPPCWSFPVVTKPMEPSALSLALSETTPIWDLIRIESNGKSNLWACGICYCMPPDMASVVFGNAVSATRGHA